MRGTNPQKHFILELCNLAACNPAQILQNKFYQSIMFDVLNVLFPDTEYAAAFAIVPETVQKRKQQRQLI